MAKRKLKIVGIDPGTRSTGVALNKPSQRTLTIETHAACEMRYRIRAIYDTIWDLLVGPKNKGYFDVVVIEKWERQFNPDMRYLIGALHMLPCETFVMVSPKTWRVDLFGGTKRDVIRPKVVAYAKKHGWDPATQHEADAACLIEWWLKYGKHKKGV